MLKMATLCTSD